MFDYNPEEDDHDAEFYENLNEDGVSQPPKVGLRWM
jgi:hypothetical protein